MNKKQLNPAVNIATGVLFFLSCFFMYDFYKCLSGFIANGFREAGNMLPLILSYLLPVISFLFYFYDFYVRPINKWVRVGYSAFIILYAVGVWVGILSNITLYVSNRQLGVYDTLPGLAIGFPFDTLIIAAVLFAMQIVNLLLIFAKPCGEWASRRESLKQYGGIKLSLAEYLILSVVAVVVFVFVGAAISAASVAMDNALYDGKFVYLLLWVLLVPLSNLLFAVVKPDRHPDTKIGVISLSLGILMNGVFTALLLIFDNVYPDFMVRVSKPIFLIAFSVSLPIEMLIILGITAAGTLMLTTRLILLLVRRRKSKKAEAEAPAEATV